MEPRALGGPLQRAGDAGLQRPHGIREPLVPPLLPPPPRLPELDHRLFWYCRRGVGDKAR